MRRTPAQNRLRARKTPQQPRSFETRARILDAAREVFGANGYSAGTTNRIAEAAGLSIGSLYQYFPNKDAILVELVRAHLADGASAVEAAAAASDPTDVEGTVRRVVAALVDVHVADRRLHQVLFEESPRPPALLAELHVVEDEIVARVGAWLAAALPGLADPELTARITVTTVESLVHRLVATDRPLDADRLVDETTLLVHGYLVGSARD
jgi:AcrR family transcriptional regulator